VDNQQISEVKANSRKVGEIPRSWEADARKSAKEIRGQENLKHLKQAK